MLRPMQLSADPAPKPWPRPDKRLLEWADQHPRAIDVVALAVVLLGGLLRFYQSTALSLWLDEGFTVLYARLPWHAVLGFEGVYDTHPPLYYAVVKAVSSLLPELVAGRYLSVVAGTLTLAVVYAITVRLLGRPAALVALVAAATSPLLIWYAQESRQYAVTGLAVATAYFALVSFYRSPSARLAALYGISLAMAMYLDYSALYALLPQAALIIVIWRRHGITRIRPLLAGSAAAVIAYLPWVPQVAATVSDLGGGRAGYLGAGPETVPPAIGSIVGLVGQGVYFAGTATSAWDRWPSLQPLFAAAVAVAVLMGVWALRRRQAALSTAMGLAGGTLIVAILVSQISPGFAPRTVSYAAMGWSILLAAAVTDGAASVARRVFAIGCATIVIGAGLVSVLGIYTGGDKEHWRELAADVVAGERFGFPTVTFPGLAPTILGLYQPSLDESHPLHLGDAPDLDALERTVTGHPAVWVAAYAIPNATKIRQHLESLGFELVAHRTYPYTLSLDLYVRPEAIPGRPVPINGAFAGSADAADGWSISPGPATFEPISTGRQLTMTSTGNGEIAAVRMLPAEAGHMYTLILEGRARLTEGASRMFLICTGPAGFLDVAPNGAGATIPTDGAWHRVILSSLCPAGTDGLRVDLRNAGNGSLDVRDVRLLAASPANPD